MKAGIIDGSKIEAMVAQLKLAAARAQGPQGTQAIANPLQAGKADAVSKGGFAEALQASLNQVNAAQGSAEVLGKRFSLGDDSVNLSDVMISSQKANIAFQATVQVRNKLVSAYQEMMNIQVYRLALKT
ncbi:MAG: fliE [Herminiimonas sp.]|nr:fliE [Herminiimonas sp.]